MDPISDMLVKIKNAQAVGKETVVFPYSKIKMQIVKILAREKFVKEAEVKGKNEKVIEVALGYNEDGGPSVGHISRVSKVSKRVYMPLKQIKPLRQGTGVRIMSTPKGVLTDKEARAEKVGGEVLCEVW